MSTEQPSDRSSDPNSKQDAKKRSEQISAPKSFGDKLIEQLQDNAPTIIVAVLLAVGVRTFIAEPRFIPSSSMEPTLQIDDRLIIEKVSFNFRKPVRGEIVIFNPPPNPAIADTSKVYIKRVIGLPGDRISIQSGKVYVNRKALTETYIAEPPAYNLPPNDNLPTSDPRSECSRCFDPKQVNKDGNLPSFTVPSGKYWVMGDNRNNSEDSHIWGFLPQENIVGRAYFRYWPLDRRVGELSTPKY
jgi:signal peptidase I